MKRLAGAVARAPRTIAPITALAAAFAIACTTAAGCKKPQPVTFEIDLPSDVQAQTVWYEVGVFRGTSCSSIDAQLSGGIPPDGPLKRLAFRADDASPPPLGTLPRDKYAFAAVARADDCSVLATGCTDVDVHNATAIKISLNATSAPSGACAAGAICDGARCVPGTDNSNPSVGANCSLELLGAGPFADPLSASTIVSTPTIVSTSQGFLIAYREYEPFAGIARLTILPIDNGGGSLGAQVTSLTACTTSDESDGLGMVWNGTSGLVALSRAPCGGAGGVDLFAIDGQGVVKKSGFTGSSGARVTLSNDHALALAGGTSLLAFTESSQAHVATANGVALSDQSTLFGGAPPHTGAWVAASDKAIALLAAGNSDGSPLPIDSGAGDDGGNDAGDDGGSPSIDAGPVVGDGALHLHLVAANANLGSLGAPIDFGGTWASLAIQGTRVIVASSGATPGRPVSYRIFDLGKTEPSAADGFTTEGLGSVLYSDVAFHQDHMFFAVERPGSIALVVYNHATTMPAFLRQLSLGADPRVPSLTSVQDGRVAIAASDTRVAVAWATRRQLTDNDPVGGYAVFACTTP